MNSQQGAEPKGVSRPSRGEDGLLRQSQETQAAVGVDAPNPPRDAAGAGPAASPQHGRELAGVRRADLVRADEEGQGVSVRCGGRGTYYSYALFDVSRGAPI